MWKSDKFYFSAQKIKKLNKIAKKNILSNYNYIPFLNLFIFFRKETFLIWLIPQIQWFTIELVLQYLVKL